jgi:hypothetical protein
MVVVCLLLGAALLYAGTLGGLGMLWTVGGGYFVVISIAAGLIENPIGVRTIVDQLGHSLRRKLEVRPVSS